MSATPFSERSPKRITQESLIFNLARGSSLRGAAGIPPKRGRIIRPLIEVTRAQIEEYCAENGLDFVTDSTNLGDEYTRNKIRHHVIPVLRELNPSFEAAVTRFTDTAAEVSDYLDIQADAALTAAETDYGYFADRLLDNHPASSETAALQSLAANIPRFAGAIYSVSPAAAAQRCLKSSCAAA